MPSKSETISSRAFREAKYGARVRRPPIDTKAAAVYIGQLPNYLEKLRCLGGGPVFIKRKGSIRYDPADLDAWIRAGKRQSTSQPS